MNSILPSFKNSQGQWRSAACVGARSWQLQSSQIREDIDCADVNTAPDMAKISIVGVGMRSHAGVASRMFRALAADGINIRMISTSEIKISVVIEDKYLELAVRSLHRAFGLEKAP